MLENPLGGVSSGSSTSSNSRKSFVILFGCKEASLDLSIGPNNLIADFSRPWGSFIFRLGIERRWIIAKLLDIGFVFTIILANPLSKCVESTSVRRVHFLLRRLFPFNRFILQVFQ